MKNITLNPFIRLHNPDRSIPLQYDEPSVRKHAVFRENKWHLSPTVTRTLRGVNYVIYLVKAVKHPGDVKVKIPIGENHFIAYLPKEHAKDAANVVAGSFER